MPKRVVVPLSALKFDEERQDKPLTVPLADLSFEPEPSSEDQQFRAWYGGMAKQYGLPPDPDDPSQFYDYRAAFKAGAKPDATNHWPSDFKKPGHPNEVVGGFNTRTGERVPGTPQASEEELVRLGWSREDAARMSRSTAPSRTVLGTLKDFGISALKSAIAVPQTAAGIGDLVTGGRVSPFLADTVGFRPSEAKAGLDQFLSPAQQAANQRVAQADGFFGTAKAMIANPSTIAQSVVESAAPMLAGGAIGRGLGLIPKVAPLVGAAIGEGAVSAGGAAQPIAEESGALTGRQTAAIGAGGVLTALIGLGSGRLASKLGITDIDALLAGAQGNPLKARELARAIIAGTAQEGGEETLQSAEEQIAQNIATGKPLTEGVESAAAAGGITGGVMGGGGQVGAFALQPKAATPAAPVPATRPAAAPVPMVGREHHAPPARPEVIPPRTAPVQNAPEAPRSVPATPPAETLYEPPIVSAATGQPAAPPISTEPPVQVEPTAPTEAVKTIAVPVSELQIDPEDAPAPQPPAQPEPIRPEATPAPAPATDATVERPPLGAGPKKRGEVDDRAVMKNLTAAERREVYRIQAELENIEYTAPKVRPLEQGERRHDGGARAKDAGIQENQGNTEVVLGSPNAPVYHDIVEDVSPTTARQIKAIIAEGIKAGQHSSVWWDRVVRVAKERAAGSPRRLKNAMGIDAEEPGAIVVNRRGADSLSPDEVTVQNRAADALENDPAGFKQRYVEQFGNVINTDNARELFADYNASKEDRTRWSRAVSAPARELARAILRDKLDNLPEERGRQFAVFTGGGPGSGKSSVLADELPGVGDKAHFVYDSTLSDSKRSAADIKATLDRGLEVVIVFTDREVGKAWSDGVLPRAMSNGRPVTIDSMVSRHTTAASVVKSLYERYKDDPRVTFYPVDNNGARSERVPLDLSSWEGRAYNEADVRADLTRRLDDAHQRGDISDLVHQASEAGRSVQPGMVRPDVARGPRESNGREDGAGAGRGMAVHGGRPASSEAPAARPELRTAGRVDEPAPSPSTKPSALPRPKADAPSGKPPVPVTPKPTTQEDAGPDGGVQPRLPGAESVRDTENKTPEFDLPFSLNAPKGPQEKAGESKRLFSIDTIDRIEQEAKARIKERGTFSGKRLGSGLPIDDLTDLAVIGAAKIARGAVHFAEWSAAMVKEFGDDIRPHLASLFKDSHERAMLAQKHLDVEDYFNFKRADISDEEKAHLSGLIAETIVRTGRVPKERITFAEIREEAQSLHPDAVKHLAAFQEAQAPFRAVRDAARRRINVLNQEIVEGRKKLVGLVDPEDLVARERVLADKERDVQGLLNTWMRMRSEDGRNLAMHRMMSDSMETWYDASFWMSRAKRALDLPPGVDLPVDVWHGLQDILSRGQTAVETGKHATEIQQELADFLTKLRKTSWLDTISAVRKAGLLTGIKTHARNLIGNTTFQLLEEIARVPAALVDMAVSVGTGHRTVQGISARGVAMSSREAATQGVKEAAQVLRTGRATGSRFENTRDTSRELNSGIRWLDAYANSVFRSLTAADRLFKSYAFRRSLEEQAALEAINRGVSPVELLATPTETMLARAVADAEFATFNNANIAAEALTYTKAALKRRGAAGKTAGFVLDIVIPFANTPANIVARMLDYTPAGAVKAGHAAVASVINGSMTPEQQRIFSQAFGRGLTGSALMYLGWTLAAAGLASGVGSDDEGDRNVKEAAGILPGAVKVNGRWHQIAAFSPVGNLIALGATMQRTATMPLHKEAMRSGKMAAVATKVVLEQPMLKGAADAIGALQRPEAKGEALLSSVSGSFVPTIVNDAASLFDPYRRDARLEGDRSAIWTGVTARLPGLRNQLPERLTVFGDPQPQDARAIWDPTIATVARDIHDDVLRELIKHDVGIGWPAKKKDETPDEYRQRVIVVGRTLHERLSKVVSSGAYRAKSADKQVELLEDAIADARRRAAKAKPSLASWMTR